MEEVGCRQDCTTWAGQTKRRIEDVTKKKKARCKHGLYHCTLWKEVRNQIPDRLGELGADGQDTKERLEVTQRSHVAPPE